MFLKKKLKAKKTGFSESRFLIEKTVFVLKPPDKANYAAKDAVLIDDREKSLLPFKNAGGKIVKFVNWTDALIKLKELLALE